MSTAARPSFTGSGSSPAPGLSHGDDRVDGGPWCRTRRRRPGPAGAKADCDRLRWADPAEPDHVVEVGTPYPEPGRRPAPAPVGCRQRQAPPGPRAGDLAGVMQRPVWVRAQVDQQAAVDEPPDHERRHIRLLADHVRGAERFRDPVRRGAGGDRRRRHRGPDGFGVLIPRWPRTGCSCRRLCVNDVRGQCGDSG